MCKIFHHFRKLILVLIYFRSNININDALGDYMLTLVDTLDTLAVSALFLLLEFESLNY